jgi:hypothetical protein
MATDTKIQELCKTAYLAAKLGAEAIKRLDQSKTASAAGLDRVSQLAVKATDSLSKLSSVHPNLVGRDIAIIKPENLGVALEDHPYTLAILDELCRQAKEAADRSQSVKPDPSGFGGRPMPSLETTDVVGNRDEVWQKNVAKYRRGR